MKPGADCVDEHGEADSANPLGEEKTEVAESESDKDRRRRADDQAGNAHLAEEFAEDDDQKEKKDGIMYQ